MAREFDHALGEQNRRERLDRVTSPDKGRQLLIDCYHSGQISERQWEQHIADDPILATM